jgi:hypothetical protein
VSKIILADFFFFEICQNFNLRKFYIFSGAKMADTSVLQSYCRLTDAGVVAGVGDSPLLLVGTEGTDYLGDLLFPGGTSSVGDVNRLFAWGTTIGGGSAGSLRMRAWLNTDGSATGNPIADTGTNTPLPNVPTAATEWCFFLQFTIRSVGANATLYCDAEYYNPNTSDRSAGKGIFTWDSTVDNYLNFSIQVNNVGTVTLKQCTVESLPAPS